MMAVWAAALVVAVLWPAHVIGPLDGAPLEKPFEAIALAVVLPTLWMLYPSFLRGRFARGIVLLLLLWKIGGSLLVAQGGWCSEFLTPYPSPGTFRLDRGWDLRTYRDASPGCTAVVARGYHTLADFPAWSINVPIDWDWIFGEGPTAVLPSPPRPPDGEYRAIVTGWMQPSRSGTLSVDVGDGVRIEGLIDGEPLPPARGNRVEAAVPAGGHEVAISLTLTGDRWRFVPRWNGSELFSAVPTAVSRPGSLRLLGGRWAAWVTPVLILALLVAWSLTALASLRPGWPIVGWDAAWLVAAIVLAALNRDALVRWSLLVLAAAAAVPVPDRLRNWRGALFLIGVPWLCVLTVRSIPEIGQFTLFSERDDWQTFQRFAYRIFMRGYWLQGGEPTFWYQPLYRWTTGVLHLAFGDSSVGDLYWDMFGLLIGALFAFQLASRFVGFRTGVLAGAVTLATVTLGPNWYIIGRGLSEISSAAWLLLAAMCLMRARTGHIGYAVGAAMFAVLAFYTRLNHLPLAIALVAFTLPDDVPAGSWFQAKKVWDRLPKRVAAAYLSCFAIGVCAFAARTWYYTGHFSVFAGTTRNFNGTGLALTADSISSAEVWRRALESVVMIVTVQDPPRFDPRAIFVVGGVCAAILALMRAPLVRRLPFHLALVCIGAIAGGLVARGLAYPGRFSIHLIPLAVTASITVAALALGAGGPDEQASSAW